MLGMVLARLSTRTDRPATARRLARSWSPDALDLTVALLLEARNQVAVRSFVGHLQAHGAARELPSERINPIHPRRTSRLQGRRTA
jgi:hypothetical protein